MNFTRNEYYCDVCGIECSGYDSYQQHIKGKKHIKEAQRAKSFPKQQLQSSYYCQVCDVMCSSPENYLQHIGGKKHKRLEKKFKQKLGDLEVENETKKKLENELQKYQRMVDYMKIKKEKEELERKRWKKKQANFADSKIKEEQNPVLKKSKIIRKIEVEGTKSISSEEKTVLINSLNDGKKKTQAELKVLYDVVAKKEPDAEYRNQMKSDWENDFKETSKMLNEEFVNRQQIKQGETQGEGEKEKTTEIGFGIDNMKYIGSSQDLNTLPRVFEFANDKKLTGLIDKFTNQSRNSFKEIIVYFEDKLEEQKDFYESKVNQLIDINKKLVLQNKKLTAQVIHGLQGSKVNSTEVNEEITEIEDSLNKFTMERK